MRIVRTAVISFFCLVVVLAAGCTELGDLKIQNETQRKRIAVLDSEIQATRLRSEQLQRQLGGIDAVHKAENDALKQTMTAVEEDLAKKKALISAMARQLIYGGASIPVELSTALEDFASTTAMVDYDSKQGLVKFKSDLLFEKGSDIVSPPAAGVIKSLCNILDDVQGKGFDIVIAGHTDDIRIGRAATREKHPTNWHLSAHRAISVLEEMVACGIAQERMSARGFGEYQPIAPNKPNKKGNPQNRRVEIYIVPKGM